jgi:hypothetical protein
MHNHHYHSHTNNLLDRIRSLQATIQSQNDKITSDCNIPPTGFTAARWNLALQSFNERFSLRRKREIIIEEQVEEERTKTENEHRELLPQQDNEFMVPFGPEWELQEAMRELETLLETK